MFIRIYAVDFGAGNTSIFRTEMTIDTRQYKLSVTDPVLLNGPTGEMSGYVIFKNGEMKVGNSSLPNMTYNNLINLLKEICWNWKKLPDAENRQRLTEYFRAWYKKFDIYIQNDNNRQLADKEFWFIGCPTSDEWKKKKTRRLYQEILEDAGFKNVTIVPESNGALAYYQKNGNVLDNLKPDEKLILLDLGAYSIDATYFKDGKLVSYGKYLGASIIEQMIVRAILHMPEQTLRMGSRIINIQAMIDVCCKEYHSDKSDERERFRNFLLYTGRRIKEQVFIAQDKPEAQVRDLLLNSNVSYVIDNQPPPEDLYLFANSDMLKLLTETMSVRDVLNYPEPELETDEEYKEATEDEKKRKQDFARLPFETQKYIGDLSWRRTLEKYLNEVAETFELESDGSNTRILLTGGGSLMPFVKVTVENRFKSATVYGAPGIETLTNIGCGIAYWAPDKVLAEMFEEKYQAMLANAQMQETLVTDYKACVDAGKLATANKEAEVLKNCLIRWRNGHCDNDEIADEFEDDFNSWYKNTGAPNFIQDFLRRVEKLKEKINTLFINEVVAPLCLKNRLGDLSVLLTKDNDIFLSISKRTEEKAFEWVAEIIVDHYHNNEVVQNLFNSLTNIKESGFIFKDYPRQEQYDANRKLLEEEFPDNEHEATQDLFNRIFITEKYGNEGNEFTLMELFIREALTYLYNLMESRKKAILGKLILEEYLQD